MRALSVRQPWTGCIVHLNKRTANRAKRFPPALLGQEIAIHAGLTVDAGVLIEVPAGADFASLFAGTDEWNAWRFRTPKRTPRADPDWPLKLALGAVVGIAKVTGCHSWSWDALCGPEREYTSPSSPGLCSPWVRLGAPWHWELADVRPLPEPVPCKGMLGL